MATQAESQVQSASRVRVELFGRVLANGFFNSDSVNNSDVPQFAAPSGGRRQGGLGGAIRQTSLGIRVDVPRVLGAAFDGELHTDFFGGQQPSVGGRHFPMLRIRTARGILSWSRAEILFGQEVPLIAGLNPVSVASFGTSEFATAGNLWLWLPQTSRDVGDRSCAGASRDSGCRPRSDDGRPGRHVRHGTRPGGALESTVSAGEAPNAVGRGGRARRDRCRRASAVGFAVPMAVWSRATPWQSDARIPLGTHVELRGEAYSGQALRGLGGGGIGQNLTTTGNPVQDRGGWAQLVLKPSTLVDLSGGCGVDDPKDVVGLPAGRTRNVACEAHITTHPGGPVVASFGWRGHRTTYAATGVARNTHLNLALGFEF